MICGHLPFDDRDTARLYDKILKGDYKVHIHMKADVTSHVLHLADSLQWLAGAYVSSVDQLPRCVSEGAADLIRRMLTVNPEQRLQIHQIRQHPW